MITSRERYPETHRRCDRAYLDRIGREEMRKREKAYYQRHREEILATRRLYRSRPDRKAYDTAQLFKRRTLQKNTSGDPRSLGILHQLIQSAARLKCAICGTNMPKKDRTIDHIIPISKGGSGDISNLQVVHKSCNSRKKAMLPHEFNGQYEFNFAGNGALSPNAFDWGELRRYLLLIATVVAHNINRNHLRGRLINGFNDHEHNGFNQCSDGLRVLKKVIGIRKAKVGHEPVR